MTEINETHRYEVRAGIEMPDEPREPRNDDKRWPFSIMDVGDSFDEPDTGDFDRCRTKASMWGYKNGKKFATRIMQRAGQLTCPVCQTGYPVPPQFIMRVWRVE